VFTAELIDAMDSFPDQSSVATLRRHGVASVTLHTDRVENTPQAEAAERSIAGLGLTRRRAGDLIVYEL
jgi:hypothetical protein